jgi:hypothetical protein
MIMKRVKPRFFAPRFTAKLAYRQHFLQSGFPYVHVVIVQFLIIKNT